MPIIAFIYSIPSAADIVIGQSAPLSGLAADAGNDLAQGTRAYLAFINASGGIHGQTIKHIVKDDQYLPGATDINTGILIEQENALALVSYFGTANVSSLLQQNVLGKASIPLVGIYSGANSLREHGSPYLFHTRAGYSEEVDKIVTILKSLGVDELGALFQDDAFGKAGLDATKRSLLKQGLKLGPTESYEKNTDNVEEAAQTLAKANPPAILLISLTRPAANFIKLFRQHGGKSQLFCLSTVNHEELIRLNGAASVAGLGVSQVYPGLDASHIKVVKEYREVMKKFAPNARLSYASLEGFINAKVLVEGIKRAGNKPTRESVRRALDEMHDLDLGNFKIDFTDRQHRGSRFVELTMLNQQGQLTR
ncbi:ABC-type branched-subunit amino acid transport system substrate-binding protein [Chitinivorax tropicus]|uniref:ABC-type branched-subunit amino acid transport system substrate-binding protein n=1 Tax=Chitinivorax tropicus TaxID=714531 RepID=A0A840MPZ6_9PROT|nr:ABC transporter substrate-binding protein [Chitinivorax tropicus]MBB5018253.1 ABC-type branched-subunit amino acid transport system substrate-binding protein [Chitinivorax tropicus]